MTTISEDDKELLAIAEDLPKLDWHWPYILFVMNVVIPGSGTMLAGCITYFPWSKTHIIVGLI